MKKAICENCKHLLNDTNDLALISICKKGMILGACWYDKTCKKWKPKKTKK